MYADTASPPPTANPSLSATLVLPQAPATSPSSVTGQVYYVSPNGSDSNAGTQAAPWRTIQAAAQGMVAGDTAILLDGVYEEPSITFANSGTADKPITIRAQNKWGAILNSISGGEPAISISQSYIAIEDIRISVSPNNADSGTYSSANAAIRAWNTYDATPSNPSTGTQGFAARGLLIDYSAARSGGIKTNQDFSIIENNVVHNEIEAFNNNGTIIRNNTVYEGGPNGTYILGKGGVRNLQVYGNNIHVNKPGGAGIILGGSSSCCWYDSSTHIEAYNSVAYNNVVTNESGGSAGLFGMWGAQDCVFSDNQGTGGQIFLALGGAAGYGTQPLNINPTFRNNTLTGNGGAATSGAYGWDGYWAGTCTLEGNTFSNYTSGIPS